MAEGDATEEFSNHQLVDVEGSRKYHVSCLVVVLRSEFKLVGQVIKRVVQFESIICGVGVPLIGERVRTCFSFELLPLLLIDLVQKEMTAYMEYFDRLLIISLQSSSREEEMSYFSESQGSMRIKELDPCRSDINIPLCKICMGQN